MKSLGQGRAEPFPMVSSVRGAGVPICCALFSGGRGERGRGEGSDTSVSSRMFCTACLSCYIDVKCYGKASLNIVLNNAHLLNWIMDALSATPLTVSTLLPQRALD